MIDMSDSALIPALPGTGEFETFQPFRFRRVFHKGGDGKVKETADEKAFADVVAQKWNHYQQKYSGLEQGYMDRVDAQDSKAAMDFAEGSANQHSRAKFSEAKEDLQGNLASAGINPNSGKFKAATNSMAVAEGQSTGETVTRAGNSQKDEYVTGVQNIVNMGQGKSAAATAGLGGLADAAADKAGSDAAEAFNESAMTQQMVGNVAGVATSYGLDNAQKKPAGYGLTTELPENQTARIGLNYDQVVG
ncbi:hypothetical protein ACL7TT_01470 [Microbulbifer sp. 2304DJ12-6]|uniref:hypothetical protein n=1 Tax=Microbulbifer sp. 2304DJ12-6 TaxID=3233340 RepID=UPI0039AFED00